jgi:hypothetical protein
LADVGTLVEMVVEGDILVKNKHAQTVALDPGAHLVKA